jgi:hypothetical protein
VGSAALQPPLTPLEHFHNTLGRVPPQQGGDLFVRLAVRVSERLGEVFRFCRADPGEAGRELLDEGLGEQDLADQAGDPPALPSRVGVEAGELRGDQFLQRLEDVPDVPVSVPGSR